METLRKLRFILYPTVFIFVFLFVSYLTFPEEVLKEAADRAITNVSFMVGPRRAGMPKVSLSRASLWRIFGVKLNGIQVAWPPEGNQSELVFELDSLKSRLGILSLLSGSKNITADLRLYQGYLDAEINLRKQNKVGSLSVYADNINVGKMSFIEALLGAPLQGKLKIGADLRSVSEMNKDGTGTIGLTMEEVAFGPGTIKLPAGGFVSSLSVPRVSLGKLGIDLVLEKGKLKSKKISLLGGDIEADLDLDVYLGRSSISTRLNGKGWFRINSEFVSNNETIKMLYDVIPELKASQQTGGKVGFSVRGSLVRPFFRLERYEEKHAQLPKGEKRASG